LYSIRVEYMNKHAPVNYVPAKSSCLCSEHFRGRLHGAFSTPGLNSALFTGLKFQPCL
jgi:hypothetical protein